MTQEDKDSIIELMEIIYARTLAGEDVCIVCYIAKVQNILNKY